MKKKTVIILCIVAVISITIAAVMTMPWGRPKMSPTDQLIQDEIDHIKQRVEMRDAVIKELIIELRMRDSLIANIQAGKTSITNKYYYDEKFILSSSDSANRVLRVNNERMFISDYFGGRYAPRSK